MKYTQNVKWHEIYSDLAQALNDFYLKHPKKTGEKFFERCLKYSDFFTLIKFANNLNNSSKSFDPIHVFASFNNYNISPSTRKKKLLFFYNILNLNTTLLQNADLDVFPFFPHPNIQNIVGSRGIEIQQDIWQFFHALYVNDEAQVKSLFNRGLKEWWGLQIPSLTTFIFWAFSDKYLPLDANTEALLMRYDIIRHRPKSYEEYIQVNIRGNGLSSDIYRNLAHYSYKDKSDVALSIENIAELNVFLHGPLLPIDLEQHEKDFSVQVEHSKQDDPVKRKVRLELAEKFPLKINAKITVYRRNPDVVAEVLFRAKGICEICKKDAPFLRKSNGSPFLEIHHIIPLSQGGPDIVDNALALCPNCHRRAHFE